MAPTFRTALVGLLTSLAGLASPSFAQSPAAWPGKPVRIVVPFSAGTGLDVLARGFAERLAEQTKSTFTVENREGAGGTIGTIAAARSAPDGLTLLFTAHAPFAVSPYMQTGATYDPINDFVPIMKVASTAMVLVTGRDSPFRQFDDVVREAKANPGKVSYATTGIGTPSHLNVEVIRREIGIDILSVPYKNTGQAMSDVIGNQVPLYMPSLPAAVPLLQSGQLRGLAIGSAKRSSVAPDIPTVAEVIKKPGVELVVWYGFLAPKGTPSEVIDQWQGLIAKAAATPQMKDTMSKLGAEPALVGPKEFREEVRRDAEQSKRLVESLNLKVEK
ncbi:MAG: tripartite tricarboxylate transporter substrate binding protein [Ideonella sp.]|nr:tripartite tricarboxylate transporter substrate binding protein [Ideonella sp.]